ncbi:hypothetical protein ES703_60049 [subsurface metagenome]
MSKFKIQQPVIHLPSYTQYLKEGTALKQEVEALGFQIPMGLLDRHYYYTNLEGWGNILYDLVFNSNLYKRDRFDCDNYALKAMNVCAERYGLNTLAMVIGDMPQGRHAFNMLYYGEGFMLWEPNEGFDWSGVPFEIGENGYVPDLILI